MKVYSCSMFFQEYDLLEIKMETLNDIVDYFVLSESNHTHSGKPKLFNLHDSLHLYKKFLPKMIYQISRDTPSDYLNLSESKATNEINRLLIQRVNGGTWWDHSVESYGRDTWEKESLIRPLFEFGCQDEDIILLSDLDEVVNPEALRQVIESFDIDQIYHFWHDVYYYYLNLRKSEPWYGTIAVSFKKFKEKSFCDMRQNKQGIFVENGGYHWTYLGDEKTNRYKIESWGEQSLNQNWVKNNLKNSIDNAIELGRDLFGRPCKFWIEPVDEQHFPKFIVDNKERFKEYIKL